ncbi:lipopolysaccharide biosynthesis protein [Thiovibrio frasassiensis]|uniref:Oligosaccharide flippase family protein n=1 Tax=Thiovibrio frasassiensis TaxID=2984131 RepID=A0A9X4MGX9_9BACT|nr:oligosaccharide flippase family protein [Thiovibrio frasassiensis]MDG4476040.1 oligosaccharide flippase family protein [Thiovibrio frasassiensis]
MVPSKVIARLRPHAARASWAVAEQAVSPLLMTALTPYLLKQLGVDQFGLWMLVMAIVGMGQLTSLGAGTATIKHVSADLENGLVEDAVATIRAAVTIVVLGGGFVTLVAAATAPLIAQIFFAKMGSFAIVSQLLVLGMVLMLIQELDNVFSSALRGAQRFDLSAKIEFFTRIVWAVGVGLLAWHYRSVVAVLSGILLLSVIKAGFKAHQVNRLLSVSICHKLSLDLLYLKRVVTFGKWQWVQSFGGMLFSVADRLLIGAVFGATDLARYSICSQLAQYVHAIPAVAMQVIFPWLSAKKEKGESIQRLPLCKYALYAGGGCFLLSVVLFISAPVLLKVWLGEKFYVDNIELALILISAYGILAFNVPVHYFLMGLGEIRFLSVTNLVAGLVSVSASLILAPLGLIWFSASKLLFGPIILINFFKVKKESK